MLGLLIKVTAAGYAGGLLAHQGCVLRPRANPVLVAAQGSKNVFKEDQPVGCLSPPRANPVTS